MRSKDYSKRIAQITRARPEKKTALKIRAFFVTLSIVALITVFSYFIKFQYEKLHAVETQIEQVEREIAEQKELTESLNYEKSMQSKSEYIENIARERLGLIHKNEIIFKKR